MLFCLRQLPQLCHRVTRLQWLDDVFPVSSIETRLTFVISFTGWSDIINMDHMKMNTFVGNTRHFDNEMDLALRSAPTLFQLRFAFVNFLTFDQAEQFMSGRPFQDVIVSIILCLNWEFRIIISPHGEIDEQCIRWEYQTFS